MPVRDLSGGLPPGVDYPLLTPSADHRLGENNGFWLFSDDGTLSLHVHLETVDPEVIRVSPANIDLRREFVMIQRNDRRMLAHDWIIGRQSNARGPGGACSASECIEPFVRWTLSYHGAPYRSEQGEMLVGLVEDRTRLQIAVDYELELVSAAPPWVQGGIGKSAAEQLMLDNGKLTGGFRYEQLVRAAGVVYLDGERVDFVGSGVRTHRRGDRNMAKLNGHVWLTGLFPSGRGFGVQSLYEPDGTLVFEEAAITDGERIVRAEVREITKLSHLRPEGEEVGFVLDSELGRMEVSGRNGAAVSARTILKRDYAGKTERWGLDLRTPRNLILTQTGARWCWNGETTYGLNERSAEFEQIEGLAERSREC